MANKLYEYLSPELSKVQISESKDGKELFMAGLFIQGDVKNQNGRVYPKDEIAKAVDSVKERLQKGETVMGELDHPEELQINDPSLDSFNAYQDVLETKSVTESGIYYDPSTTQLVDDDNYLDIAQTDYGNV